MKGHELSHERIETDRLVLVRPVAADAQEIFDRYASDPKVTRYLAWPTHGSVEDTRLFVGFSDAEWERSPAGPYLIRSREDGRLLGASGLSFDPTGAATTGYVIARDAWGRGYATEALGAMIDLARSLGLPKLAAYCHPDHAPSIRVLEKRGFTAAGIVPSFAEFPNLTPGVKLDVAKYVKSLVGPFGL